MYFIFKNKDLSPKSNIPSPISSLGTSHTPVTAHFVLTHLCAFAYAVPLA